MKSFVKQAVQSTRLYRALQNQSSKKKQLTQLVAWETEGRPVPPPHIIKQGVLRKYAQEYGLTILVETGTFFGDMVEAMRQDFERIYSIELSDELYKKARQRFKGAINIELVHGDSGTEIERIVKQLDRPALFWLDGHFSGGMTARGGQDTPVLEEVRHILASAEPGHVIVIDDARCFGTDPSYPSIPELREIITSRRPDVGISVEDDSIRIVPSRGAP